ncbi:MAG: ATP-binding protein [Bacteroidota bacterium]
MKKIVFISFILALFNTIFILFISHTLLNDKQILSIIFLVLFVSFLLLYFAFKYQIEKNIIDNIYQKIKKLLSFPNEYSSHIYNIQDIEKIINIIENESKKAQEHFKNLDSYRKEYLGNVSHELKTPLFNVQGYISTLLDGAAEEKEILFEYLKKADKNIERMLSIIDDLETISHLESGAMILEFESFDLETLINEVFEQMELSAKNRNIKLILIKDPTQFYLVTADKFRIRQVLINLISNSIKYGKENGITEVILKKENNKVMVSVNDNGIGIEEKHLPRIFERFYRVDKGRSREQGGTGLGLAIVKHIIEAHQQNISVKSRVGVGTTFTFSLDSA